MSIVDVLNDAADALSAVSSKVTLYDVWVLSQAPQHRTLFQYEHAWAYVEAAAVVEHAVKGMLRSVLEAINDERLRRNELRYSLFSLLEHTEFASLRDLSKLKLVWTARCRVVTECNSSEEAVFPLECLPLDGRTIEARHMEVIWVVFGFDGECFPSPLHKMSLIEMSQLRNDLAHGEKSKEQVGRTKLLREVQRMIELTEDTLEHLACSAESYLAQRAYRR